MKDKGAQVFRFDGNGEGGSPSFSVGGRIIAGGIVYFYPTFRYQYFLLLAESCIFTPHFATNIFLLLAEPHSFTPPAKT
jgi:hypothetical protein